MSDADDQDSAGEYVLGTLASSERVAFEGALRTSAALRAEVQAWERRLAPLADAIAEVAPDTTVWSAIERRLGAGLGSPAPQRPTAEIIPLRRSRARWRAFAVAATAVAAVLALYVGTGLRPTPTASYLAVVNRGGDLPALVVEVDTKSETVRIRSLAAETPSNKTLQLWYIAASGAAPRSLGLVGSGNQTAAFPQTRSADLAGGTVAVSVEPVGGSTTGGPTGPVIYSGKLIAN